VHRVCTLSPTILFVKDDSSVSAPYPCAARRHATFRLTTPDGALDALRDRLRAARWPEPLLDGTGWDLGTDLGHLRELVAYWADSRLRPVRRRRHSNIVHWTEMPSGGHLAPFEEPELYVDDLRALFRTYRGGR